MHVDVAVLLWRVQILAHSLNDIAVIPSTEVCLEHCRSDLTISGRQEIDWYVVWQVVRTGAQTLLDRLLVNLASDSNVSMRLESAHGMTGAALAANHVGSCC